MVVCNYPILQSTGGAISFLFGEWLVTTTWLSCCVNWILQTQIGQRYSTAFLVTNSQQLLFVAWVGAQFITLALDLFDSAGVQETVTDAAPDLPPDGRSSTLKDKNSGSVRPGQTAEVTGEGTTLIVVSCTVTPPNNQAICAIPLGYCDSAEIGWHLMPMSILQRFAAQAFNSTSTALQTGWSIKVHKSKNVCRHKYQNPHSRPLVPPSSAKTVLVLFLHDP